MKTRKYVVSAIVILFTLIFLAVIATLAGNAGTGTAEAGRAQMACTSDPQAGIEVMQFDNSNFALQQVTFIPACNLKAVITASGNGDYGANEDVTAKIINQGNGIGAISLELTDTDAFTGTARVSWQIVPATQ